MKMNGVYVAAGQFGAWTPIGAEQAANGGYQVAWKNGALDQYIGWNVDGNGNYLAQGTVWRGPAWYAESSRSVLRQNLNGDATIGLVTTADRSLWRDQPDEGRQLLFSSSYASTTGPQLKMTGVYVTAGQFGAWTPIGAEQTARRLPGRLEERRRRSVHRVERRRQRQLPLAECRGVGREHRAASARARFQPGSQWRRCDHGEDRHRVLRLDHLAKIANTFVVSPTTSALGRSS